MRGTVMKPEDADGAGIITGDDGRTYAFLTRHVHKSAALSAGDLVDFLPIGDDARDVYVPQAPMPTMAEAAASRPRYRPPTGLRSPRKADHAFRYYLNGLTKNYARFKGRARRAEYWSFTALSAVVLLSAIIADASIYALVEYYSASKGLVYEPFIAIGYFAYTLIPSLSILVRRLHDTSRSGWMVLISVFPYIGLGWLLFMVIGDSEREANKHGESPKYS